jgi:oxygen-independent coproporphyrinogen-3 oxidase
VDATRWKNLSSTTDYVARIGRGEPVMVDRTELSAQARLEEALFTGLRLSTGVDGGNISATHGVDPWLRYGSSLMQYVSDGLMWKTGDRFGLTRAGMLVANEILATFV